MFNNSYRATYIMSIEQDISSIQALLDALSSKVRAGTPAVAKASLPVSPPPASPLLSPHSHGDEMGRLQQEINRMRSERDMWRNRALSLAASQKLSIEREKELLPNGLRGNHHMFESLTATYIHRRNQHHSMVAHPLLLSSKFPLPFLPSFRFLCLSPHPTTLLPCD